MAAVGMRLTMRAAGAAAGGGAARGYSRRGASAFTITPRQGVGTRPRPRRAAPLRSVERGGGAGAGAGGSSEEDPEGTPLNPPWHLLNSTSAPDPASPELQAQRATDIAAVINALTARIDAAPDVPLSAAAVSAAVAAGNSESEQAPQYEVEAYTRPLVQLNVSIVCGARWVRKVCVAQWRQSSVDSEKNGSG